MDLEDIRQYLPSYLSEDSTHSLFESLKQFPQNIDDRLYSTAHLEEGLVLQGDGLTDLLVVALPDERVQPAPCMVLSNTCDIDLENKRIFASRICYAPILNLEKYKQLLLARSSDDGQRIEDHIGAIRRQEISQIFYLPRGQSLEYEGIVFLDRVVNCDNRALPRESLDSRRLFSLSNFGLYLFLFKLSIHFTRIREEIDRG